MIAVFEVEDVLLHYTRNLGKMMTSNLSRKAYHVNVCVEAVNFMRRGPPNENILSHVGYEGDGTGSHKASIVRIWTERISRLSWTKKVYITVTRKNGTKKAG